MRIDRIVAARQYHRYTALRVVGCGGSNGVGGLVEQDDAAASAMSGQCGGQTGHTGADYDDVGRIPPSGTRPHSPPPGWPISIIRWTLSRPAAATSGST